MPQKALSAVGALHGTSGFTYFVMINSSVRGPFLPAPLLGLLSWTTALTRLLDARTRLVGGAVSCCNWPVSPTRCPAYRSVHLDSCLLTTDAAGLRLIAPQMHCSEDKLEVIARTEIGMSQARLSP